MFEAIISQLQIPQWILIVLIFGWLLWQIFKFVSETNRKNTESSNLSATIKSLESLMIKIKNDIKFMSNYLAEKSEKNFDRTQLESCSPLKLTSTGEKFLSDIEFMGIFKDNQDDFFQIIDSEHPTTKYDVEISARKAFIILSEKDYFKPIKIYLYNNPEKRLDSISITAGVYVRDQYLEKHSEITK